MFKTQIGSFYMCHCKAPVFIIIDYGVKQRFEFHDEAPG